METAEDSRPRIAITMGDPAGIGPEICLQTLAQCRPDHPRRLAERCVPIVFGDASVLQAVARHLDWKLEAQILPADQWINQPTVLTEPTILDLNVVDGQQLKPGAVDASCGRASFEYVVEAIDAAMDGKIDGITTGPIHKEALNAAGLRYPGHTEIFAERTAAERSCMMLTSEAITCSFVTTHVGYSSVPGLLSVERILNVIELSHDAMTRMRGRPPRMLACGLNPHAGEHGLFGQREEERFIVPAIEAAQAKGIDVQGPLPPDTVFLPERRAEMDCFICMYHDQGHIPLKALAFDLAVNVTLGLPIIRTSVDHGTAFDIAWQGRADISSMNHALDLAVRMATPTQSGSGVAR